MWPIVAQRIKNRTRIHEDAGSIPGPSQWAKDPVGVALSCGSGPRCSSDPAAAAPIQPLAWEFSYALDAALKRRKTRSSRRGAVVNESD